MTRSWTLAALAFLALAPAPVAAQASASAYTRALRYDGRGRVTGAIEPDGPGDNTFQAVRNSYDGGGRLIKVETGELAAWQSENIQPSTWAGFTIFRSTEYSYDVMGHKVRETVREGAAGTIRAVTQYSFDTMGRLECTAVRMNPAAFGSLPASACSLSTYDAALGYDRITQNVYDAASQRVQLREGVGTSDEGAEATWEYDSSGRVVTLIDGNGNRAALHYDGQGRQDRWTFPSATRATAFNDATQATALASAGSVNTNDYEAYSYDLNGNRTAHRKRDGSLLGYTYDALNRSLVKTVPERMTGSQALDPAQTRDIYYAYDLLGLQLRARFDSLTGDGVTSRYDGFGRQTRSTIAMAGTSRSLDYASDRNGNRTRITHPDGNWWQQDYDQLDRPTWLSWEASSGIIYINRFAHGGPQAVNRANATSTTFSYDGVQRAVTFANDHLTNDVAWTFSRNAAGQLSGISRDNDAYAWGGHYAVSRPYTTNGLNQYSAAGAASFTYDNNGNLINDGVHTYVFDIENRLVGAPGGVVLVYDPLGRLYQVSSTAGGARTFLYDGDALVSEYAGATLVRRHVHGVGADVPVITYEGAALSDPRYLFADHQGSIVALTNTAGAVTQINSFDEYGIPGAGNAGTFQFTGQIFLPELGMYHYKARIFSPTLGRFLQTDPVGYKDQYNLYAYVGDDPVNRADPTGMHGRGTGFSDPQWNSYDRAQRLRAAQYERAVVRINRALAGGERSGAFRSEKQHFERVFGRGAGTAEHMREVADRLTGMADALKDDGSRGYIANGLTAEQYRSQPGTSPNGFAFVPDGDRHTMNVNVDHPSYNDPARLGRAVGHESGHSIGLDDAIVDGVTAYRYGNSNTMHAYDALRRDPARALTNPDNLVEISE